MSTAYHTSLRAAQVKWRFMLRFISLRFYACCKCTVQMYTEKILYAWSCHTGSFLYLEKVSQEYHKLEEHSPKVSDSCSPSTFFQSTCKFINSSWAENQHKHSMTSVVPPLVPQPAVGYRLSAPPPVTIMDQSLRVTRRGIC